jgi:hypothetical protein
VLGESIVLGNYQHFRQTQVEEVPRVAMPVADEIFSYYARGRKDGRLVESAIGCWRHDFVSLAG